MPQSVIASLTGRKLSEVIDIPSPAIITGAIPMSNHVYLFTATPVAMCDVTAYLTEEPS
jgi:hypothetical protein